MTLTRTDITSIKTMVLNAMLFYPTMILGGYLLLNKSMFLYLLYIAALAVTLIAGRCVICRSCVHYGKPCPSFGFSYLAKIFPKAVGKPFNGRAALVETWIIGACLTLPVITLISSWIGLVKSFSPSENILMGIYIALIIIMSLVHKRTGCDKCEIQDCPLSKV
jgi:hypothetical protein